MGVGRSFTVLVFVSSLLTSGANRANNSCMKDFVVKEGKCVSREAQALSWIGAKRLCESLGGHLPILHDVDSNSWLDLISDDKGKPADKWTNGRKIETTSIPKGEGCLYYQRNQPTLTSFNLTFKSCDSLLKVKCVHDAWHYRGKCPSEFLHVGHKCFKILPQTYYKAMNHPTELNNRCARIQGTVKGRAGKIVDRYEHAALTVMMRLYPFNALLMVDSGYTTQIGISGNNGFLQIYGSTSLVPGYINKAIWPYFYGLVCESNMITDSDNTYTNYFGHWSQQNCPTNYETFGSYPYCYRKMNGGMKFNEAIGECSKDGGHLPTITNEYDEAMASLLVLTLSADMFIGVKGYVNGIVQLSDGRFSTYSRYVKPETSKETYDCFAFDKDGVGKDCVKADVKQFYCAKRRRGNSANLKIKRCADETCIKLGKLKYFKKSVCDPGSTLAQFKSREIVKVLYDWVRGGGNSNDQMKMTGVQSYYRYSSGSSIYIDPKCHWSSMNCTWTNEKTICQKRFTPSTETPPSVTKANQDWKLDSNNLVIFLIAVIIILIVLGLVVVCLYCYRRKRSRPTSEDPEPPFPKKRSFDQDETTSFSPPIAPKPKLKPPANVVSDEDQGIFEEEYADLD